MEPQGGGGGRGCWCERRRSAPRRRSILRPRLGPCDCGSQTSAEPWQTALPRPTTPAATVLGCKRGGQGLRRCEHGNVKTKQAKPATHPLLAPVQTKKTLHPHAVFGTEACLPLRQTATHRRGCCGCSSVEGRLSGLGTRLRCRGHGEEQGWSHCRPVIFMIYNVVAPTIFLASL